MNITPKLLSHVPKYLIYQAYMGNQTLFSDGHSVYLTVPNQCKKGVCACSCGFDVYRIINNEQQVLEIIEKQIDIKILLNGILQTHDWKDFWEQLYIEQPHLKPISIVV